MRTKTEIFELVVEGKPVIVKATPYQTPDTETHFRVSYNDSPVHIFGWDPSLNRLTVIDSGRAVGDIPRKVDEAIGTKLYHLIAA